MYDDVYSIEKFIYQWRIDAIMIGIMIMTLEGSLSVSCAQMKLYKSCNVSVEDINWVKWLALFRVQVALVSPIYRFNRTEKKAKTVRLVANNWTKLVWKSFIHLITHPLERTARTDIELAPQAYTQLWPLILPFPTTPLLFRAVLRVRLCVRLRLCLLVCVCVYEGASSPSS